MPYPNFHAARVRDPDDFIEGTFRTIQLRPGVSLILGKLKSDGKNGPMTAQAYRFDKRKFTVDQAKDWLKKHKVKTILFEPAREEEAREMSQIAKRIFDDVLGEISTLSNIAPNQKPSFQVMRRKKVKKIVDQMFDDIFNRLEEKWTRAFINELPDSSFAYIEPGGEKDEEGKTYPRYLRHFPVKDEKGNWDRAHLINALARFRQIDKKTSPWLTDEAKRKILSVIKAGYKALDMEFPELEEEMGDFAVTRPLWKGILEGGPGSGNWGHRGRPGMRGGSLPGGGLMYRVKGGPPKSLGAAALIDYGEYYTASGGLNMKEYKTLSDDMKLSVLRHGIESYQEKYIPKAQQGGLSPEALDLNKKIGALEGMRRSALNKAKGLTGKEERAAYPIALSLQTRAQEFASKMKETGSQVTAGTIATARAAEAQPKG